LNQPARRDIPHALNPAAERPGPPAAADADVIGAILATLNERTVRTYLADDRDCARFLGAPDPRSAVPALMSMSPGAAIGCALPDRVTCPAGV